MAAPWAGASVGTGRSRATRTRTRRGRNGGRPGAGSVAHRTPGAPHPLAALCHARLHAWVKDVVARPQAVNTGGERRQADIKHRKSSKDNLFHAADMVAGAIYASRAHGRDSYLRLIQARVRDVWDWDGEQ